MISKVSKLSSQGCKTMNQSTPYIWLRLKKFTTKLWKYKWSKDSRTSEVYSLLTLSARKIGNSSSKRRHWTALTNLSTSAAWSVYTPIFRYWSISYLPSNKPCFSSIIKLVLLTQVTLAAKKRKFQSWLTRLKEIQIKRWNNLLTLFSVTRKFRILTENYWKVYSE